MSGPRRYDLVVFDCDGVLVDSERLSARIGRARLARLGWRLGLREYGELFVGCTDEFWYRTIDERVGPLPAGWHDGVETEHEEVFARELREVDGVRTVLDGLAGAGILTCVASNGSHRKIATSLALTELADRFAGRVFSAHDVVAGKPAPDLLLHAAAVLGVPPGRCAVVEDSPAGARAARLAGMDCYGLVGELVDPGRLAAEGAQLVTSLAALRDLLVTP